MRHVSHHIHHVWFLQCRWCLGEISLVRLWTRAHCVHRHRTSSQSQRRLNTWESQSLLAELHQTLSPTEQQCSSSSPECFLQHARAENVNVCLYHVIKKKSWDTTRLKCFLHNSNTETCITFYRQIRATPQILTPGWDSAVIRCLVLFHRLWNGQSARGWVVARRKSRGRKSLFKCRIFSRFHQRNHQLQSLTHTLFVPLDSGIAVVQIGEKTREGHRLANLNCGHWDQCIWIKREYIIGIIHIYILLEITVKLLQNKETLIVYYIEIVWQHLHPWRRRSDMIHKKIILFRIFVGFSESKGDEI